jgi:hypothetical protein
MGTAASTENDGRSEDCKKFCDCFLQLAQAGKDNLACRRQAWMAVDYNGNGKVSLAETDAWVMTTLKGEYGEEEGDRLWRYFRPSFIRAFNDAKDVDMDVREDNDYVTKREFRILSAYLCIYASIYDAFQAIENNDTNAGDSDGNDRRISFEEWDAGYDKMAQYGFVALQRIADDSLPDVTKQSVFAEVAGGSSENEQITLMEFSNWIAAQEKAADPPTPIGALLSVGDDDQ